MRKPYDRQYHFGATTIAELQLKLNCRDKIVLILVALRHAYLDIRQRNWLTKLIVADLSQDKRRDTSRPGLDD